MKRNRQDAAHTIDPGRYRSQLLQLWREVSSARFRCPVQCVGTGVDELPRQLRHIERGFTDLVEPYRVVSDEQKRGGGQQVAKSASKSGEGATEMAGGVTICALWPEKACQRLTRG